MYEYCGMHFCPTVFVIFFFAKTKGGEPTKKIVTAAARSLRDSGNDTASFALVASNPDGGYKRVETLLKSSSATPPFLPAGSLTSLSCNSLPPSPEHKNNRMGATHARPVVAPAGGNRNNNNGGAERTTVDDTSTSARESAKGGCGCLISANARHHAAQLRALRRLERRFNRSDTNKSGGISYEEMCRTLRIENDLMSVRLFSLLDADGNKEITFPELSAALATFSHSELDRARFAFCLYDLDGNGGEGGRREKRAHHRPELPPRPSFVVGFFIFYFFLG